MRRANFCLAALIAIWPALCGPAAAASNARSAEAVLDVMPDTGDRLELVDELLKAKKWARALEKLAQIAEEAEGTVWSTDGTIYIPLEAHIRNRMIAMPAEGLAFYRLRYDPEAEAMLREGVAKQSVAILDAVGAAYPASSFAGPALDAAASVLIDRGNFDAASDRLLRLLDRPRAAGAPASETRLRAAALAKLAFCRAGLGDQAGARQALDRLRKLGDAGRISAGGGTIGLDALVAAALERAPAPDIPPRVEAWSMPGGSLAHARPMAAPRFNLSKRWEHRIRAVPSSAGPAAVRRLPRGGRAVVFNQRGQRQAPAASPLPAMDAAGVMYVNTGERVIAFEHITGRVRWTSKPPRAPAPAPAGPRVIGGWAYQGRFMALLWPAWPGGSSVSLGGGKVFALEHARDTRTQLLARSLAAFDAATGSRLWTIRQDAAGHGFEAGAFFPWAPKFVDLPGGPVVIGQACYREQMFLCSVDANTGKLKWKVYLCADPTRVMTMYGRPGGPLALGQPAVIGDGVVYAATGMGVVAAVDARTGGVRWLSRYPRSAVRVVAGDPRRGRITQYQPKGGWGGGFPVLAGGRLFVAPADANELLLFDRRTGAILKQIPRGEFAWFAGVRNGAAVLVGKETAAVDVETGVFEWLMPTALDIHGMPVLSETALIIPTKGQVCEIALDAPVVRRLHPVAGANVKLPLGNLVCFQGRLLAANPFFVTGYFSFDETYTFLTKQIEKDPRAIKPLMDRADLCHLHRRYGDALRDLQTVERALGAEGTSDDKLSARLKRMMFETRLMLSETDVPNAVAHADAAEPYIFSPAARVRFHLARGAALVGARRHEDAIDAYVTIAEELGTVKLPRDDESSESAAMVAQARIGQLVDHHGHGVYARVDKRLRPTYEQAVAAGDSAALRTLYLAHPHSSLADNCLFELAKLTAGEKYGEARAQSYLLSLARGYLRSDVLDEAVGMLVANCEKSGRYHLAAVVLRDLRDRHPAAKISWKGETISPGELYDRLLALEAFRRAARGRGLPLLVPPLRTLWRAGDGLELPVAVISDENCFDRGIGLAVDVAPGPPPHQYYGRISRVRAFDMADGRTLWRAKLNVAWSFGDLETDTSPWARSRHRALVVCSGAVAAFCHSDGVAAFDIGTGRPLWTVKWKRPVARNPTQWFDQAAFRRLNYRVRRSVNPRPVFTSDAGRLFCYLPDTRLLCIDTATGRTLWQAKGKGFGRGTIGLFNDVLVVTTIQPNTIVGYETRTGRLLYTKQEQAGPSPSTPAYDRERGRVFVSDGNRLTCYRATDGGRLWTSKGGPPSAIGPQPWYLRALSGEQVAVFKQNRQGKSTGWELTLVGGKDGKPVWSKFIGLYERKGRDFRRINCVHSPLFAGRFIFVPTQEYERKTVNKRAQTRRGQAVVVLDRKTGKTLRSFKQDGTVYPVAGAGTAEHAAMVYREVDPRGRRQVLRLHVISGETGKSVLTDSLTDIPASGIQFSLILQRFLPTVTVDGRLVVPNGKGLTCYGTGGSEVKNEKK